MFSSKRAVRPWSVIVPYGVSLGNDIHVIGEAEVTSGNFVLWSTCNVTVVPRPDHVDRFAAPCTGSPGPGRAHRATSGDARGDRARRRRGTVDRADRGGAAGVRGHRAQVAPPLVRGTGGGVAARRATLRPATGVQCGAGRECQGGGLHATGRCRVAEVSVELARHAVAEGICASISTATVRRWLSEDALKPWQYRSWIFITDPDFAAKAKRVLDLYDRVWDGTPLGGNDYVISADEKTSIQARCRCHPTLPPGKSRTMRVNHDYGRGGAVAYLAAYDVHRATVFGRCEQTTGIEPFRRLVRVSRMGRR